MLENTKECIKRVESQEGKRGEGCKRLLYLFFVISLVYSNIGEKKQREKGKKEGGGKKEEREG